MATVYANAGEKVTCENGHPICEFVKTVHVGEMQALEHQLGNWQQPVPDGGALPIPGCAACGAAFTDGMLFHINQAWRDPENRRR